MNEIPERIEREMFEIRSRMAPDVRDLKQHVEPKAVTRKLTARIKDRVRSAGKNLVESVKRQANMVGEAGRKKSPAPLTDAVKSDPRPLVLLVITLFITLLAARKISNGRGD
ncbi:DUF3618 domain-containing protein [Rubrobacter tropicus]|uniref:DUF3618 domain-containing protein n=1 Tax=Rubrobacter tropicus TaxID=2653851 RepID=A0A6G8QEG4_9ACTN|nr:DUF3618 domain-containing protein [Rubrobacter tropicus]QIN84895.1 DUF3618 domain-containing protein [Rubrobacter tropicus]